MPTTIEISTNLVTVTCCNTACGILYAVPERWNRVKRSDHTDFYCPNGHSQGYADQTEEEKLRGVVTKLKNRAAAGRCAFCDHEFDDVAAHVAQEHPGVVTDATDEDEAEA